MGGRNKNKRFAQISIIVSIFITIGLGFNELEIGCKGHSHVLRLQISLKYSSVDIKM